MAKKPATLYYDRQWREQQNVFTDETGILQQVRQIRQRLPRVGTRKLQELLALVLASHQIEVGRDYLFGLLQEHRLLIRQRKRKKCTPQTPGTGCASMLTYPHN